MEEARQKAPCGSTDMGCPGDAERRQFWGCTVPIVGDRHTDPQGLGGTRRGWVGVGAKPLDGPGLSLEPLGRVAATPGTRIPSPAVMGAGRDWPCLMFLESHGEQEPRLRLPGREGGRGCTKAGRASQQVCPQHLPLPTGSGQPGPCTFSSALLLQEQVGSRARRAVPSPPGPAQCSGMQS